MKNMRTTFPHFRSPMKSQKPERSTDDLTRSESPPETTEPTREGRRERRGVAAEAVWRPCNSV